MTKRKLNKLTLRRETLTTLELSEANGGAGGGNTTIVAGTQASVCRVCYPKPILTEELTWPIETSGIAVSH